jgi:translation initiation factor IF-3
LGVLSIEQAIERAGEFGFDLVEVNPMAKPPVCKIMDYGKFKYEEKKKASEAKKKQVVVHLKEVKLRPKTEEHDYEFKVRNVKRFLEEGNKAKVTIMFRGREITHKELGQAILDDVVKDLKEIGVVEQTPRMEGRQMFMIISPSPKVAQRARDLAKAQAAAAEAKEKAENAAKARPEKPQLTPEQKAAEKAAKRAQYLAANPEAAAAAAAAKAEKIEKAAGQQAEGQAPAGSAAPQTPPPGANDRR